MNTEDLVIHVQLKGGGKKKKNHVLQQCISAIAKLAKVKGFDPMLI